MRIHIHYPKEKKIISHKLLFLKNVGYASQGSRFRRLKPNITNITLNYQFQSYKTLKPEGERGEKNLTMNHIHYFLTIALKELFFDPWAWRHMSYSSKYKTRQTRQPSNI